MPACIEVYIAQNQCLSYFYIGKRSVESGSNRWGLRYLLHFCQFTCCNYIYPPVLPVATLYFLIPFYFPFPGTELYTGFAHTKACKIILYIFSPFPRQCKIIIVCAQVIGIAYY